MPDFLNLTGQTFLVQGVANRKSVAWFIARTLLEQGARVAYVVRSEKRRTELAKLLGDAPVFVCDVEPEGAAARLAAEVAAAGLGPLHGLVHSIAFANYAEGFKPFPATKRADFLQATAISAFSLVEMAHALRPQFAPGASIVTLGISSLLVTPDNYGYMGPIKAALESAARFLAKSYAGEVRVNVVGAGPLKTSASAGIPGYVESYVFAEKMTFRKKALATQEVADAAVYLLSSRSSGLNGTTLTVDAGLGSNYFDAELVRLAMRPETPPLR
jgi:enoyl-[acyl-carrier protein] reductase I